MKLVTRVNNASAKISLSLVGLIAIIVLFSSPAFALTDHLVFSINGDSTATSMVQGDTMSWGANCAVGATLLWEIWYDVNNNSAIDDPGDKMIFTFAIADGDTNSDGPPPDINPTPDGVFWASPMVLGIAPGKYVFRVTDMSDMTSATNAITATALPTPPNTFVGRIVLPGHPAPDADALGMQWVEANLDGEAQMWSALTNDSGKFTINVGDAGTGKTFNIDPPAIAGFVTPARQTEVASGDITLTDFTYLAPSDSVYGTVLDENGDELLGEIEVWASPQFAGPGQKDATVSNGQYVLLFGSSELGEWWLGVSQNQLIPNYVVPQSFPIDNSSTHGIEQNFICPNADTVLYVKVTENGGEPGSAYHINASSQTEHVWYTEAFTGTGSGNIAALHITSWHDSGWTVTPVTWDTLFPIPEGFILEGSNPSDLHPGDTAELNFVSGTMIRDTVHVDAGDPVVNWDNIWMNLWTMSSSVGTNPDANGVYTIWADTGTYSLSVNCAGYLVIPTTRSLHLLHDTTGGLGFTINSAHCRVHGTLNNVPGPIPAGVFVNASAAGGYSASAEVDTTNGTYELLLCDGSWTITPPTVPSRISPTIPLLTIGESPDTVRTVDLDYTVISDVGDGQAGIPKAFALRQNYPNPFNPSTQISYDLPHRSHVTLAVFNLLGQEVTTLVNGEMSAGNHTVTWDGKDSRGFRAASGIYFYRLIADSYSDIKKMLYLK
jgi:hypothetical protein